MCLSDTSELIKKMKFIHHGVTECTEIFQYFPCFIILCVLRGSVVHSIFLEPFRFLLLKFQTNAFIHFSRLFSDGTYLKLVTTVKF